MQIRLTQHTPRPPLDSVFVTCSLFFEELSWDVCLTVSLYYIFYSLKRVWGEILWQICWSSTARFSGVSTLTILSKCYAHGKVYYRIGMYTAQLWKRHIIQTVTAEDNDGIWLYTVWRYVLDCEFVFLSHVAWFWGWQCLKYQNNYWVDNPDSECKTFMVHRRCFSSGGTMRLTFVVWVKRLDTIVWI